MEDTERWEFLGFLISSSDHLLSYRLVGGYLEHRTGSLFLDLQSMTVRNPKGLSELP